MSAASEHVFEAFWIPRWYGQDQPMAVGQEDMFAFRGAVPPGRSIAIFAAGLDLPRNEIACRVLGIKHAAHGRIQAVSVDADGYGFILGSGERVSVRTDGSDAEHVDWTLRVTLQWLVEDTES